MCVCVCSDTGEGERGGKAGGGHGNFAEGNVTEKDEERKEENSDVASSEEGEEPPTRLELQETTAMKWDCESILRSETHINWFIHNYSRTVPPQWPWTSQLILQSGNIDCFSQIGYLLHAQMYWWQMSWWDWYAERFWRRIFWCLQSALCDELKHLDKPAKVYS